MHACARATTDAEYADLRKHEPAKSPGGEIGRRRGLKIPRWQHRDGSIPFPGTILNGSKSTTYTLLLLPLPLLSAITTYLSILVQFWSSQ